MILLPKFALAALERFQDKWIPLSTSETQPAEGLGPGFESVKTGGMSLGDPLNYIAPKARVKVGRWNISPAVPARPRAGKAALALMLDRVSSSYADNINVLENISLSLESGEFVGLVGPSGCGKSTLLKVIAGLTAHSAGDLWLDRSSLGYVFQDPNLLPWRTMQSNVELLMELRGIERDDRRQISSQRIELMGLAGFEAHYPGQLSGGMKMRVALARALTLDPDIFLFDEPFAALDEITRQRLNGELSALHQRRNFAGIFVTHSIVEAVYLSSKVSLMSSNPGRIVKTFDIPFAYPRAPELRYTSEFADICAEISAALAEIEQS